MKTYYVNKYLIQLIESPLIVILYFKKVSTPDLSNFIDQNF